MYLSQLGVIVLVIIVMIVGFMAGRQLKEGFGREFPSHVRHPNTNNLAQGTVGARGKIGGVLNELVDTWMNTYFDAEGYIYKDTIEYFRTKLIAELEEDGNGLVEPDTIQKLKQIGLYFIRVVIPRLGHLNTTTDDPKKWNPIVFTNMGDANINYDDSIYASVLSTTDQRGFMKRKSSSASPVAAGAPSPAAGKKSSSTTTASKTTGTKGKGGSGSSGTGGKSACNVTEGCNQQCPTSCIQAALVSLSSDSKNKPVVPPTSGRDMSSLTRSLNSYEFKEWWSLFTEEDDSGVGASTGADGDMEVEPSRRKIRVAKEETFPVIPPYSDKLDYKIREMYINKYFDVKTGNPTEYFIEQYKNYTKDNIPMDEIHMNRLTDMIFYVIEVVISGLPTEESPQYYFKWRPLNKLSARKFP